LAEILAKMANGGSIIIFEVVVVAVKSIKKYLREKAEKPVTPITTPVPVAVSGN
jgi:hypothetical protein